MGMTAHKMDNGSTIWFNSSNEEIMVEQGDTRIYIEAKWIWMFVESALRDVTVAKAEQSSLEDLLGVHVHGMPNPSQQ